MLYFSGTLDRTDIAAIGVYGSTEDIFLSVSFEAFLKSLQCLFIYFPIDRIFKYLFNIYQSGFALGDATGIRVGQKLWGGKPEKAKEVTKTGYILSGKSVGTLFLQRTVFKGTC